MKPSEREQLVKDLLADERVERLRETSLAAMLGAARDRRRRRTLVSGVAASLAVGMMLFVLLRREPPAPLPDPSPQSRSSPVKIINDEQLLDLFPEGSVALIGPAGKQRLIFLESRATASVPSEKR